MTRARWILTSFRAGEVLGRPTSPITLAHAYDVLEAIERDEPSVVRVEAELVRPEHAAAARARAPRARRTWLRDSEGSFAL